MNSVTLADAFEQYVGDVYGYLGYRTRSRRAAEDLTQETFERAMREWGAFQRSKGSTRAWLLTIARAVYIDSRLRRTPRPPAVVPEPDNESAVGEGAHVVGGPDRQVAAALARLERREREAIALRFGGDLRIAEIADLLGISASNAQQVLARALRRLHSIDDHTGA